MRKVRTFYCFFVCKRYFKINKGLQLLNPDCLRRNHEKTRYFVSVPAVGYDLYQSFYSRLLSFLVESVYVAWVSSSLYSLCAVFLGLAFFFENRWKSERGGFYPRFYYIPRFAFSLLPCILYYFWYCISFDFFYGALPLLVFILAEVFFSSVTFAYSEKAKPIEG